MREREILLFPRRAREPTWTGLDIVPDLIVQAQNIADTLGVKCQFRYRGRGGNAVRDETFDVVMSMFGAMFAPRPMLLQAN
jgi:hypothetical protein